MSINTLRKTRWKIDPRSISVYPYGVFYILCVCIALAFGVFFYVNSAPREVIITLSAIVVVIGLFGSTKIIFDSEKQLMQKKLFGFLTIVSIPYEKLEAINIVRNNVGGFNFRAFRKNDKFGKGTAVSGGYSKETDPNALAFIAEVIQAVHATLDQTHPLDTTPKAPIGTYNFFIANQSEYTVKRSKVFLWVMAVALIGFAVFAIMDDSVMPNAKPLMKYAIIGGSFVFGLLLAIGTFTKTIFDTAGKVVRVVSPYRNKEYAFEDFDGFQIVRRSTNMIYTGTDVQIYFRENNNRKAGMLVLNTFMGTKKIDQFLEETRSIME
jgi:hypothetical protein